MAEAAAGIVPMTRETSMRRVLVVAVCAAGVSAASMAAMRAAEAAPERAAQRAGAPPQTPPAQPGQRGRGRGRGAVQVMALTTTAWRDGGEIPVKYAQAGDEVSPPLAWSGVPEGVQSFALVAHDLDALSRGETVLHWLVWNIPGTATSLPEGVPHGSQLPDGTRQISVSGPYYRGPGAPATGPPHHYVFELYALDAMLEVAPPEASPAETRAAVIAAMADRIRGKGVLVGRYRAAPAK
jgi:hypothetical protein